MIDSIILERALREKPVPIFSQRALAATLALALVAASLGACGRRGPLELPPETQARGAYLRAQTQAAQAKAAARGAPPPENAPAPPIPGTVGNRPPDQYPFPLDPLL